MNSLKQLVHFSSYAVLLIVTVFLCGVTVPGVAAEDDEIAIAAASDLNFAIKEIVAEFEKSTGKHVKLSLGSSGNFYAQIQNGAPFDLYFSADIGYPKKLEEAGLTVPGSLYRYAVGRIVLWTNHEAHRDVSKGMEILRDSAIKKIAIANPKHAPYGRAAVAAMEHFKVYEQAKDRVVLGENIS
ncbi:MAG TPA: molybdate ABC transporter substrate-binding protein, partial [Nitrospira sp.]|nr:molybdate ABC transporter substrate-binding protein [Nitrospira sp.]